MRRLADRLPLAGDLGRHLGVAAFELELRRQEAVDRGDVAVADDGDAGLQPCEFQAIGSGQVLPRHPVRQRGGRGQSAALAERRERAAVVRCGQLRAAQFLFGEEQQQRAVDDGLAVGLEDAHVVADALEARAGARGALLAAVGLHRVPVHRVLELELRQRGRRRAARGRELLQHGDGVVALAVGSGLREPAAQVRATGRVEDAARVGEQGLPAAIRIGARLGGLEKRGGFSRVEQLLRRRGREAGAQAHHRDRSRPIAVLGAAVGDCHFVVVGQHALREVAIDGSDADHAERVELRGAQRAHAGAAVDRDALVQRVEDLLVPDGRHAFEQAVDDGDGARLLAGRAVDVAHLRRRAVVGIAEGAGGVQRQAGAEEDDVLHAANSRCSRRARGPGR